MSDTSKPRYSLLPASIAPPFGRYAHGVAVCLPGTSGTLVTASGQLGLTSDGIVPDDVGAQATICFANIDAILSEAELNRSHVVHVRAFITDRTLMAGYMQARDAWLADVEDVPASTLMIVSGFTRPEFKVEIEVLAVG